MTIIFAKFANASRSSVELLTVEAGSVIVSLDGRDVSGGWQEVYSEWAPENETAEYVEPARTRAVSEHLASFGFDAIALLNLSDVERKFAAQPVDLPPKCATALSWVNAVQVAYASGQTLPDAPCTLPELFAEIAPLLKP
ncbi:MAG: hypothetical protein BGO12_19775 [Verrucomicrobia bacterium 61-8]|nr:hypothetical protein [Verrucomicrobiota bacterium]OJV17453.1 MAG: hypothetical protein BGO12_19775 [Verrucomicrobia bacterium 61-8]